MANSPYGKVGKAVDLEIAEATKYLSGKGYNVQVDRHFTWNDFTKVGANCDVKAFFFLGHSDATTHDLIFFGADGNPGSVSPNLIKYAMGGRKFDWVTLHACNSEQKDLRNILVSPSGSWWASRATYNPLQHIDNSPRRNQGGGKWQNFAK